MYRWRWHWEMTPGIYEGKSWKEVLAVTEAQLSRMRDVDIRTVDPATLVELRTVHVDEKLPKEQRIRQYANQIKNPYCYLDDGVVVKISFSDVKETLEDRLLAYIRSC